MERASLVYHGRFKTINFAIRNFGFINKAYADAKIKELGDYLFGIDHWDFIHEDDSFISTESKDIYHAYIGDNCLTYNCERPNTYNKAGYVWVISSLFHEYQHYQQQIDWDVDKLILQDKNNPVQMGIDRLKELPFRKAVARRNIVCRYVLPVYTWNYGQDPREFDAEEYRIRNTMMYFNSMKNTMINGSTAGCILYEIMTADDYFHHSRLCKTYPHNIEDVEKFFRLEKIKAFIIKYVINP